MKHSCTFLIPQIIIIFTCEAAPPADTLNLNAMLQPLPGSFTEIDGKTVISSPAVLEDANDFILGASVIKGEDGRYHMFCATFSGDIKFSGSWLLPGRIRYYVSDYPDKGFTFQKDFLKPVAEDGNPDAWDAQMVHNPHVKRFSGKVYLYYIGSKALPRPPEGKPGHETSLRNLIQLNQKIGVIEANSVAGLVARNWDWPVKPLLALRTRVADHTFNPSPEGTVPKPDNLIVFNPSVVYCPPLKKYLTTSRAMCTIRPGGACTA